MRIVSYLLVLLVLGGVDLAIAQCGMGEDQLDEPVTLSTTLVPLKLRGGDLNPDGHVDLVVGTGLAQINVLLGIGGGEFSTAGVVPTSGIAAQSVAIVDVNQDAALDVVVVLTTSDSVEVFLGDGVGGLSVHGTFPTGLLPVDIVAIDFDNNGTIDLATLDVGSGDVSILWGDGTGDFGPVTTIAVAGDATGLGVGDFDLANTSD